MLDFESKHHLYIFYLYVIIYLALMYYLTLIDFSHVQLSEN